MIRKRPLGRVSDFKFIFISLELLAGDFHCLTLFTAFRPPMHTIHFLSLKFMFIVFICEIGEGYVLPIIFFFYVP